MDRWGIKERMGHTDGWWVNGRKAGREGEKEGGCVGTICHTLGCMLSHFSSVRLCSTLRAAARQAPLSVGIL